MTSKERIDQAFRHGRPDRTPCFEYCLNSEAITALALGRPCAYLNWDDCVREKGWEGAVRQTVVDRLDIAAFFGHDMLYVTQNPTPPAPCPASSAPAAELDDPVEKVARRNQARRAADGALDERSFLVYKLLREEMARRGDKLPVLAPAYCHGVWTDVDLMQTMALEPEVAHEHFALATLQAERLADHYLGLGVEMVGIGGDFAGNRPLISPECYREFIVPELRKLSERLHRGGAYAVNASDGNLWGVIDAFLVESGVDGYLEIDLHAGMDLRKLKQAYGSRTTFLGNMDCGNTLSFAAPEAVARATRECLEAGMGGGGHIFTASNAITASVPPENYLAMANAYRDYFGMPPLRFG